MSASELKVSFEFFPPKTDAGTDKLVVTANTLGQLNPEFVSVTYGAGGTTRDRTVGALAALNAGTLLEVAGHLTCVGGSISETHDVIDSYRSIGLDRIVALRGDLPEDGVAVGGYQDAAELIAGIRSRADGADFDVSVAAYPEVHPRAESPEADLASLVTKIDAGADRALTQFFFDTDAFLRLRDAAVSAGVSIPVVPGIMPVHNFAGICRFAAGCGTVIPDWMPSLFEGLEDDKDKSFEVSADLAVRMCETLLEEGVEEFHFFTMNQAGLTAEVCKRLGFGTRNGTGETS